MAKRVIFELKDSSGAAVAGAKVKATDCGELESNADGLAVFLIDADDYTVSVNGKDVYSGKLADASDDRISITV